MSDSSLDERTLINYVSKLFAAKSQPSDGVGRVHFLRIFGSSNRFNYKIHWKWKYERKKKPAS